MLARRPILALALTLLAGAMPAFANTFPTQPVRFIVPFPPGGSADALTRMLAQRMQAAWGQAVVVENKPGGTVIGTDLVAKAAPDGHTIALVIPSLAVNPSIMAQLPYDTVKDLAGVTLISTLPIARKTFIVWMIALIFFAIACQKLWIMGQDVDQPFSDINPIEEWF